VEKNAAALAASLSPLPRTIHALWHVYEFFIGRHKPACEFMPSEHGGKKLNITVAELSGML
jgi:hypothetical protein